jgi:hypothetical protein
MEFARFHQQFACSLRPSNERVKADETLFDLFRYFALENEMA